MGSGIKGIVRNLVGGAAHLVFLLYQAVAVLVLDMVIELKIAEILLVTAVEILVEDWGSYCSSYIQPLLKIILIIVFSKKRCRKGEPLQLCFLLI